MRTNFQMIKELLLLYNPEEEGVVSREEQKLIKETLRLAEMDILALRNLRDFVVLFVKDHDKMSAIVYIIDTEIFDRGGEV